MVDAVERIADRTVDSYLHPDAPELHDEQRAGEGGDELTRASFSAINGIAGGMRNTG